MGIKTGAVLSIAAVAIVLAIVGSRGVVIGDTEEDIWPDPRKREAVHLSLLSEKLQAYARDHDSLPESLAAYRQGARLDLWDTPHEYSRAAGIVLLRSAGPDRAFGTSDDITLRDGSMLDDGKRQMLQRDSVAPGRTHVPPI